MALVSGGRSSLNPKAPLFIHAVVQQVEEFSPEWWNFVHHHLVQALLAEGLLAELPDSFDFGVDEEILNMEAQYEEFLQSAEASKAARRKAENEILCKLFQVLSEWRSTQKRKKRDPHKLNWSKFHLSVIHGYVLKLNLTSDSRLMREAKLLNDEFMLQEPKIIADYEKVARFMLELLEVFIVPEQHHLFEIWDDNLFQRSRVIVVAAFIDMLLRLLHHRPVSMSSMEGRIGQLHKNLRFLLAVLGDEPSVFIEHEQGRNEFEAVVNKAGSLVHSIVFSVKGDERFITIDKQLGTLLERMKHLIAKIIKFSKVQRVMSITDAYITRNNAADAVDSLFIVDSLLGDLDDLWNREDAVVADVKDQVKSLQKELKNVNLFVIKASHSQRHDLKEYVIQIRDAAYEAEYLINSFLDGDAPPSTRYLSIRLSHVVRKIKSIETRMYETRNNFCDEIGVSKFAQLSLQNNRSNADVEDVIVGFDDIANEILFNLQDGEADLKSISIHGMPGVGKTTLAKKLYNHPSVKGWFDRSSWCVVSQQYDKRSLLIDILVGLGDLKRWDKDEILNAEEEKLKVLIHQSLWNRRYLIVLDDVWSLDAWFDLQSCFPNDKIGSRILFTSRNKYVAALPNSITYELLPTSDEHCWEILREKVFKNKPCPPHLLKIGKEIAVSCRGLPLVVLLVVGILSTKDNEESTWKEVKRNLASYVFSDAQSNYITQILELSYDNLQDHLKPCFLYFGAFPRARRIRVPELLRLWIAEGFVRKEEGKSPESLAKEWLMELIDKSLVTVVERRLDGGVKTCVVHDLLHEFCLQKCGEEILHAVVDKRYSMNEKNQRLRIHYFVKSPRLPLFGLHVRSILGCFPKSGFLNMRLLRVLDLMGELSYESLNEIKVLINLRHLAIGYGDPSQQPQPLKLAFITSLLKLEFLIIKSQFYLVCTPSELKKMMKLRHVQVYTSVQFGEELCSISQENNNLDFLSMVAISNANDEQILRCSPHLHRLKCKCQPFLVGEKRELGYPDFSFFTELESLHMEADPNHRVIEISLPSNIIELTLYGLCMPWEKMSVVGRLKKLQDLKLISSFVGETWVTEDGEFEQLHFLTLKTVFELKEWRVETWDHFPKLRGLILDDCEHLQEIPDEIGEIPTLQLIQIKGHCKMTLKKSAKKIEQEQKDVGNELLKLEYPKILTNTVNTYQTAGSMFTLYPIDW